MSKDDCVRAARAIRERDFIGWRGFPTTCGAAELLGAPPPADLAERPKRALGDGFVEAVAVLLDLPGYYRPTASFRGGKLVLLDGMNPAVKGGAAALRADLGAPAARLDFEHGTLPIAAGEWAFPARGITLFVEPVNGEILHVALYHPTDLAEYVHALRPHLGKRPWPVSVP